MGQLPGYHNRRELSGKKVNHTTISKYLITIDDQNIVKGRGKVQIGEDIFISSYNQSLYIPTGVKHRITNTSNEILVIIETQVGDYLEEDDITRLEDEYNR
jgi:hypothetical protein